MAMLKCRYMTPQRNRSNGGFLQPHHHAFSRVHVRLYAWQRQKMKPISEASFMQQVKALAYIHGWDCHHASPTQTAKGRWLTSGAVGFPDLVLCHKVKGLIFAELKSAKGRTSPAQEHWLSILHPHAECYIWRPEDLQLIEQRLASS